jgi:hypothetical protein
MTSKESQKEQRIEDIVLFFEYGYELELITFFLTSA